MPSVSMPIRPAIRRLRCTVPRTMRWQRYSLRTSPGACGLWQRPDLIYSCSAMNMVGSYGSGDISSACNIRLLPDYISFTTCKSISVRVPANGANQCVSEPNPRSVLFVCGQNAATDPRQDQPPCFEVFSHPLITNQTR